MRSADEDDQVRFAVSHGYAVWWRLLWFLPHAFLWFPLRKNGIFLYAVNFFVYCVYSNGLIYIMFLFLISKCSGFARYQPGATSLEFHFHSDESTNLSGFLISFEQVYNCWTTHDMLMRRTSEVKCWIAGAQQTFFFRPSPIITPVQFKMPILLLDLHAPLVLHLIICSFIPLISIWPLCVRKFCFLLYGGS